MPYKYLKSNTPRNERIFLQPHLHSLSAPPVSPALCTAPHGPVTHAGDLAVLTDGSFTPTQSVFASQFPPTVSTLTALTSLDGQGFIFSLLDYTAPRPPCPAYSLTLGRAQFLYPAESHDLSILQGLPFSIGYSSANSSRLRALPSLPLIYR